MFAARFSTRTSKRDFALAELDAALAFGAGHGARRGEDGARPSRRRRCPSSPPPGAPASVPRRAPAQRERRDSIPFPSSVFSLACGPAQAVAQIRRQSFRDALRRSRGFAQVMQHAVARVARGLGPRAHHERAARPGRREEIEPVAVGQPDVEDQGVEGARRERRRAPPRGCPPAPRRHRAPRGSGASERRSVASSSTISTRVSIGSPSRPRTRLLQRPCPRGRAREASRTRVSAA